MSIRTSLVKALARTEMPGALNGKGLDLDLEQKADPTIPVPFWPTAIWNATDGVGSETSLNRQTAFAASALAYICINYRAQKLQEPPLMVVEETDDGDEWLEDHELNPLLAKPNPDYQMRQMLALTSIYRDIDGMALWLKVRERSGLTRRLYAFGRDSFRIESDDDRLYARFRVNTMAGEELVGAEDAVFFPGIDPQDPLGAISPLEVALRILGIGDDLRKAARDALRNSMAPSGVLSVKEDLREDEFERTKGYLVQQHGGMKRGNPLLLTNGATWTQIQTTIPDMMPTELIAWIESTVCAVFQLHPALLGIKSGLENSPWSHLATAKRMLYDEMAIPRWTADAEILTEQLLRDVDFDPAHLIRFDTASIPALQDDLTEKADLAVKGSGFMTVDEKRALMGYAPIGGELGATILVPSTLIPLEHLTSLGIPTLQPINGGGQPQDDPDAEAELEDEDDGEDG